jgi:hypothetical protein
MVRWPGRLYISPHTVNTHLQHVFAERDVPDRVALAAVAHHSIKRCLRRRPPAQSIACSQLRSPFRCCQARPKRSGSRWPRAGPVRHARCGPAPIIGGAGQAGPEEGEETMTPKTVHLPAAGGLGSKRCHLRRVFAELGAADRVGLAAVVHHPIE